jgi:hypothetical protein
MNEEKILLLRRQRGYGVRTLPAFCLVEGHVDDHTILQPEAAGSFVPERLADINRRLRFGV